MKNADYKIIAALLVWNLALSISLIVVIDHLKTL